MTLRKPVADSSIRLATQEEISRLPREAELSDDWVIEFKKAALEVSARQLEFAIREAQRSVYLYPIEKVANAISHRGKVVVPPLGYLDWVMRPTDAADARANLEDAFEKWVDRHGEDEARRILKWQGFRITAGYIMDRAVNRLGQFVKLLRFGY